MSTFGHSEPDLCGCGQKAWHSLPCLFKPLRCPNGTPKSNYECVPMKAALDDTVGCVRCGRELGLTN